jgi:hypothetical protein
MLYELISTVCSLTLAPTCVGKLVQDVCEIMQLSVHFVLFLSFLHRAGYVLVISFVIVYFCANGCASSAPSLRFVRANPPRQPSRLRFLRANPLGCASSAPTLPVALPLRQPSRLRQYA